MKFTNNIDVITDLCGHLELKVELESQKVFKNFHILEIVAQEYIEQAIYENKLSNFIKDKYKKSTSIGASDKIAETINSLLSIEQKEGILQSDHVKNLINIKPEIMDDNVLKKERYKIETISDELQQRACKKHSTFIQMMKGKNNNDNKIISLAKLLYLVRSNIAHTGKTETGFNLEKIKRDSEISKTTNKILANINNEILEEPNNKILFYGLLKDGSESNKTILENIGGKSKKVKIYGEIIEHGGLKNYQHSQEEIEVDLFISENLQNILSLIDEYERRGQYKRVYIPYKDTNGDVKIANIYMNLSWMRPGREE